MRAHLMGALLLTGGLVACTSVPVASVPAAFPSQADREPPPSALVPADSASEPASEPSPAATDGTSSGTHPLAGEEAWIAYQTFRSNREGVWLIHPDGTGDHEVALDVPGLRLHPDWSPDGTRLIVSSRAADEEALFEVDVDSDKSRRLWPCAAPCVGDDEAVWSPDGMRVAFVRAMEPFVDDVPSCALYLGDPATGEVEPLSETGSCWDRETFPHWSSDGSRLAYYRGVYAGGTTESTALYVLDIASGRETKLTEDALFAGDSDWSADDEWIIFSTYPLNDFQCCEVSNLYRIHPDGSGLEQLTDQTTPDVRLTQPRFTPDGQRVVITGVRSSSRELWILSPDGSGEPVVVSRGGIYTHGTWQPS